MTDTAPEFETFKETEEGTFFQVAHPGTGPKPLTPEEIKFILANHTDTFLSLSRVIADQQQSISVLLHGLTAYMIQYPLDESKVARAQEPENVPIGAYL